MLSPLQPAVAGKSVEDCETEIGALAPSERQALLMQCLLDAAEPAKPAPPPLPPTKRSPFKSNPADARKVAAEGKRAVLNALKDPESARFRNLKTSLDLYFCGEVNAKNSMGGYTGFTRFIVMFSHVDLDDGSDKFRDDWWVSCEGIERSDLEALKARIR
ncbi:hypothetical protein [Acidovorax radicis]|uniref:hypothetical protein n=1 Tax=Acidovorax radicis TaxID=758826 RepID=UPI001CF867B3|nr:hypothetical protein [Acidovorax radicis]UCU97700.1 hypothetical protein KI609_14055 [Acidovorax radicis]